MYKSYKTPVVKAYPDLKIPEPRISRFVIFICRLLGRLYLFLFYGVARIVLQDNDHLCNAFKRALSGESRCIIAFRHPNGGEPQLLSWYFLFKLRSAAARKGIKFARWPHSVCVYGYEVVRWGGWAARFIMPNIGAMPIHHSRMDSTGMARIYNAIVNGPYPVSLAPEGQVSYTADSIPRLEQGVIRIGFQAAERLSAKGMDCPLEILPVSVHFRFGPWGSMTMELLLRKIEKACGLSRQPKLPFGERLGRCRDHILRVNEARYKIQSDDSRSFEERLDKVIHAALETGERMLGLKSEGDYFFRLYRLRQACWDRIFLPGVESFEDMTYVERNVNDLNSGEAWYIARHQELADFCWYFRIPLPVEGTAFHNKIEYVQNLWDFANRTMGGAYADRVSIFPRRMIIHAAPVINLSERLPSYSESRKTAIAAALSDLEKSFLACISMAKNED